MTELGFIDAELLELERAHLLRSPRSRADLPRDAIWLCSNDYLGLAGAPLQAASSAPAGAGASALVWGHGPEHDAAERALASYTGVEACLLFSSGYAANVGVVAALAGRGDLVVSDALNHASLIDGCRLSGARVVVVPHLDLDGVSRALRSSARRRFVVTESYFSMDADGPDLGELAARCRSAGAALIVDEAHALGTLGPSGRGRCAEAGVLPDVLIGTLGKSFGLAGAFVGGSRALRTWLWNRARSFVFSTAISPAMASGVPARVAQVAQADEDRAHLSRLSVDFREAIFEQLGVRPGGFGPVIPIAVPSPEAALAAAGELLHEGFVVQAMRPPTVPPGTSRLRVTLRASLSSDVVRRGAAAVAAVVSRQRGTAGRARGGSVTVVPPLERPVVIAVVGTGTEIGKTVVATRLVAHLRELGIRVAGRKPVESGVEGDVGADQRLLEGASSPGIQAGPAPYRFVDPVSPHLAARREGRQIDLRVAVEWARGPGLRTAEVPALDVAVVESAGGLLSPLGDGVTNLDLVEALEPAAVILVCPDRLGVLHEVGACRLALTARGLWSRVVVCLNGVGRSDASTGTNAGELEWLLGGRVVASAWGVEGDGGGGGEGGVGRELWHGVREVSPDAQAVRVRTAASAE